MRKYKVCNDGRGAEERNERKREDNKGGGRRTCEGETTRGENCENEPGGKISVRDRKRQEKTCGAEEETGQEEE